MSDPILLGERLRIEVPNAAITSGDKYSSVAWCTRKEQKSGLLSKHQHLALLEQNAASELADLISFKSADGRNVSNDDDAVRYGDPFSIRCLTRSKAGGRYLSPSSDSLVWDRHAEALRRDHDINKKKAEKEDEFGVPDAHNEMFRVIHIVASNMRRDWQHNVTATGNPLVPSSKFGLVHIKRLEGGKQPAYVAASEDGKSLHFVADLSSLCVFTVRRVNLEQILQTEGLLSPLPKTISSLNDEDTHAPIESSVGEIKESGSSSNNKKVRPTELSALLDDFPSELIECQTYSFGQWIARKGDYRFCTINNRPLKLNKSLVPWWTADGLSHWRVVLDADDNDGDDICDTDREGWMYGNGWSKMFKDVNPQVSNERSKYKYRMRKFEKLDLSKLLEYDVRCGTCSGELVVPRWRKPQPDGNGKIVDGITDDEDVDFQHGDLPQTEGTPSNLQEKIEEDEQLEILYKALTKGDESLKMHHVQDLDGFQNGEFEALDTNGDGTVTLEEFKEHARKTNLVKTNNEKKFSSTSNVDVPTVWAGQALLPKQTTWKGRVIISNKWFNENKDIVDYAVIKEILKELPSAPNVEEMEEKEEKEEKEVTRKKKKKRKEKKRKLKEEREEANKELSNGRPYIYADLSVDIQSSILNLVVINDEKKKEGKNNSIDINLKKYGLSIESIPERIVASNSLEENLRNQEKKKFNDIVTSIEELQERRKKLPPNNNSAKNKINELINEQIKNKIKQRDQMLGRPPQQGWLCLRMKDEKNQVSELIFSPLENESSFISSESEFEIGKRENYQNNFEIVRSVIIDSMRDTNEMRTIINNELRLAMSKLASMKQFTTTNGANDLFEKFNKDTIGMAEIDERIDGLQKSQREALVRIKNKIIELENGNLAHEIAEGLKSWVRDIQETEKKSEEAAKIGLEILEGQIEGLELMSNDIIDAAKNQAVLTLQYAVPYVPYGGSQWRIDLENGKSDETLKKLTSKMTTQVATVTGVPETIVNASIESKTGVKTGPSISDQVSGIFQKKDDEKNDQNGEGDVEMVAVEIKPEDEVKVADTVEEGDKEEDKDNEEKESEPITSEQARLLGEFRAPKQPEEYWYENHLCLFKFMFFMCAFNVILAVISMFIVPLL
jgi:hypothetical protein